MFYFINFSGSKGGKSFELLFASLVTCCYCQTEMTVICKGRTSRRTLFRNVCQLQESSFSSNLITSWKLIFQFGSLQSGKRHGCLPLTRFWAKREMKQWSASSSNSILRILNSKVKKVSIILFGDYIYFRTPYNMHYFLSPSKCEHFDWLTWNTWQWMANEIARARLLLVLTAC